MGNKKEPKYFGEDMIEREVLENYPIIIYSFEYGKYQIELRRGEVLGGNGEVIGEHDVVFLKNRRMYISRKLFNVVFKSLLPLDPKDDLIYDIIGVFQVPNNNSLEMRSLTLQKTIVGKYQLGCETFTEQDLKNLESLINFKFNNK